MMTTSFFVSGIAQPAGSKTAYPRRNGRGFNVTDSCKKSGPWKGVVSYFAAKAQNGRPLFTGPLALAIIFYRTRPKNHYGSGRNAAVLKADAPAYPTTKPDSTKLVRAVEDAMTGIVWRDDAQIAEQYVTKRWGESAGAAVMVWEINSDQDLMKPVFQSPEITAA